MLSSSSAQTNPTSSTTEVITESPKQTMLVTIAEMRLLERLRMFKAPMLLTLIVGGDGEPKELFVPETAIRREVLAR